MSDITVAKTVVDNVGGLKHLEIDHTSPVIYVSGENGSGKSSLLEAYSLVFDAGNRPDMIGPHDDFARVELTLSDGTKITRTQRRSRGEYTIVTGEGFKITEKPGEYVKKLVSGLALRPAELLLKNKKERVEVLQEIIQMEFSKAELDAACRYDTFIKKPVLNISEFDQFVDGVREKRKDANSKQDMAGSTLRTLKRDLPEGDDQKNWSAEARRLESELRNVDSEITAIDQKANSILAKEIDAVKAKLERDIEALRKTAAEDIETLRNECNVAVAEKKSPLSAHRDQVNQQLAVARQNAQNAAAIVAKREQIAKVDKQYRDALQQHSDLDDAVKNLEKLRLQKLSQSPIQGLEIRGDEIFLDGLNLDTQVNKAQQILTAFQIMARANRGMNFFVLDDAEHLDADMRAEFMAACRKKGFQVVLAAAEAGKGLTVEPMLFEEQAVA